MSLHIYLLLVNAWFRNNTVDHIIKLPDVKPDYLLVTGILPLIYLTSHPRQLSLSSFTRRHNDHSDHAHYHVRLCVDGC